MSTENTIEMSTSDYDDYESLSYLELCEIKKGLSKSHMKMLRKLNHIDKILEKKHKKEVKSSKKNRRNKSDKKNKEPSGFNKPSKIPVEFHEQIYDY